MFGAMWHTKLQDSQNALPHETKQTTACFDACGKAVVHAASQHVVNAASHRHAASTRTQSLATYAIAYV